MAIYHLNAKVISRTNGQSATAAAAYRAGDKIHDERTGLTFDYTRKQGVYTTEILAPNNAPNWVANRSQLWNAAELIERRSNSRTAREFDIALPVELTHPQKQELVREFVTENFVNNGLVADIAFHEIDSHNPHVHILITTRKINETGLTTKDRNLDRKDFLLGLRKSWEFHANQALERIGNSERIDHRTLSSQGLNRIPQIHLGANVAAMIKRGISTERGSEYNRIQMANQQIEALETQLATLDKTIEAEREVIEQSQADLNNLGTANTIIRVIRYLNPTPSQNWRIYDGNRYIFRASLDEQTLELHAKDGRGLILEKKDGKINGTVSNGDIEAMKAINAEITRRIAQREQEQQQQRRRRRGFSRWGKFRLNKLYSLFSHH